MDSRVTAHISVFLARAAPQRANTYFLRRDAGESLRIVQQTVADRVANRPVPERTRPCQGRGSVPNGYAKRPESAHI